MEEMIDYKASGVPMESLAVDPLSDNDSITKKGKHRIDKEAKSSLAIDGFNQSMAIQQPSGMIMAFAFNSPLPGWLPCDGSALDESNQEHRNLLAMGMKAIPDLRGQRIMHPANDVATACDEGPSECSDSDIYFMEPHHRAIDDAETHVPSALPYYTCIKL